MRLSQIAICCVAAVATFSNSFEMASSTTPTTLAILTPAQQAKIAPKLLSAVHADELVEADIMVQLESPEQVMQRVCENDAALSRAQKTTCMVDNLQQFADASQQQVKDLLAHRTSEFRDSTFFWINNSVSVKKAKGSLVLALAALDTVLQIRPEQIFHTMTSGGDTSEDKKEEPTKTKAAFGFSTLN